MPKTLIVVERSDDLEKYSQFENVITFEQYLEYRYDNQTSHSGKDTKLRIINLCSSIGYLSVGYYCSLFAEARQHRVLPSIRTFNDLSQPVLTDIELVAVKPIIKKLEAQLIKLKDCGNNTVSVMSFFGKTIDPVFQDLAKKLFSHFSAPILKIVLSYEDSWLCRVELLGTNELSGDEHKFFEQALADYTSRTWVNKRAETNAKFDLAILTDPDERLPPSDKKALQKFARASKRLGIACEFITEQDFHRIAEFDGLFIRATTAIDNFTYRFAKKAEAEGVVVIDDPTSIIRCTNKIYLADLFRVKNISSPKTELIRDVKADLDRIEQALGYPMVLKIPDGAFSVGVVKVKSRTELEESCKKLFVRSSLLLAQEFLYTEYDWRIGVLNGKAIFASRYYMVKNHWQIYQHGSKRVSSGGFETIDVNLAPKAVVESALRATKAINNGFYGVDIKEKDGKGYVIEVNDNPSIDYGVEDAFLGDKLYEVIMREFLRRFENRVKA